MTQKFAVIYGDEYMQYDLGQEHPLNQTRLLLTYEMMDQVGLLSAPQVSVVSPDAASLERVMLFHRDYYLDYVRHACSIGTGFLDGGDTPAFRGGLESSQFVVGGSLTGVDVVMQGKVDHAFNIGGGLHHAHCDRASGFCVLNDVAVAISYLRSAYGIDRIVYLDIDAHHGDGVMYGFYGDPNLLNIDFHEDGHYLFPGTGRMVELGEGSGKRTKVNVPLPPHCGDSSFLAAFRDLVPRLIRRFEPQIILLQCGADGHGGDPLTDLNFSMQTYVEVANTIHGLAHELCDGRLLMFGGGGYNVANVARCWTMMAAVVAEVPVADKVPDLWRLEFQQATGEAAPLYFSEPPTIDNHAERIGQTVSFLKGQLSLGD